MQPDEIMTDSMRQEEDGRREMEHEAEALRRERFDELPPLTQAMGVALDAVYEAMERTEEDA